MPPLTQAIRNIPSFRPVHSRSGQGGSTSNQPLGRIGCLETWLASDLRDVRLAQSLRYQVFFEEMAAKPGFIRQLMRRDFDHWDRHCDHLLVRDTSNKDAPIVATYRLLRQETAARKNVPFYSESEFNLEPVLARFDQLRFLELGRSCVRSGWRNKRTIELLWHGSWSYVRRHGIDVMFGCASFPGTDPQRHAEALSFLRHCARPSKSWDIRAQIGRAANYAPIEHAKIDPKRALAQLPPLIKGYLRLGAWVGKDAVVDPQFGTTDVLIILPIARLNPRYVSYYGVNADRHGADKQ